MSLYVFRDGHSQRVNLTLARFDNNGNHYYFTSSRARNSTNGIYIIRSLRTHRTGCLFYVSETFLPQYYISDFPEIYVCENIFNKVKA